MEKQRELDQELKIILNVECSNQNGLVRNSKTSLPVHSVEPSNQCPSNQFDLHGVSSEPTLTLSY